MIKKLLLIVIILLMAVAPVAGRGQKNNDTLVIAISNDFQPFTFLNAEGRPAGMFVDIWRLWGQKTGKKIEFISSDWNTSLENLERGEADIHSGLMFSPERSGLMSGGLPLYQTNVQFFYPLKLGKVADLGNLSGETVAVVKGTQLETFLLRHYPQIKVLGCATREELVRVSQTGKAKGFIAISPVGTALIDRQGVSGEFAKQDQILFSEDIHPGILKKDTKLIVLVNKGLSAITNQEWADVEARWIADPKKRYYKPANMVKFTAAEKEWLSKHKSIRVGVAPVFPPLNFSEKGEIKGIEPDYLRLLSEYTGIKFHQVICDLSVMDAKVKAGEIDMFLSFNIPERQTYVTFTEPLMEFKQIIIARHDAPYLNGLGALQGQKVAIVKKGGGYDKMLASYPDIEAVPVDSIEQMFRAVAESKADALISKTIFAGHVIHHYPNLKIAGVVDLPPEPYLYAVRKDYPALTDILNKAITAIPKDKHDAIVQKWVSMQLEHRPNWSEIREWSLVAGGGFALVLGLTLYWNRRLSLEIVRQKRVEEALQKSRLILNETGRMAKVGGWEFDVETMETVWTEEVYRIHEVGLTYKPELAQVLEFYTAESRPVIVAALQRAIDSGEPFDLSIEFITAKGNQRWVHAVGRAIQEQGKTRKVAGTFQDITGYKQMEEILSQSNEQLQFVLDGSQLGFWDWHIESGKVVRNERWAKMLGYTLDEVELNVKQWTDLIHPDDRDRAWNSIQSHLDGLTPFHAVEYRMCTKDGEYLWILDQAKVVKRDGQGRPARMSGTHTDMTVRKLADQSRIRLKVESEERSRLARELHDGSGQSLQAIRLHLQLLAAGKGVDDMPLLLNQLAEEVAGTASELRDIAHQLRPAYLQDINLDTAVLSRCEMLRRRGLPVSVTCAGDFSQISHLLSDNIYRIFQEALANAVRHAAAGHIRVYLARTASALRLIVSDNGRGMAGRAGGDGMGLRIMNERAAMIGARLTIASDPKGTTVTLAREER